MFINDIPYPAAAFHEYGLWNDLFYVKSPEYDPFSILYCSLLPSP